MLSRTTWIRTINAKKHTGQNIPDFLECHMVLQQLLITFRPVRGFRRCRCYTFTIVLGVSVLCAGRFGTVTRHDVDVGLTRPKRYVSRYILSLHANRRGSQTRERPPGSPYRTNREEGSALGGPYSSTKLSILYTLRTRTRPFVRPTYPSPSSTHRQFTGGR
jgi:hypothetical protein